MLAPNAPKSPLRAENRPEVLSEQYPIHVNRGESKWIALRDSVAPNRTKNRKKTIILVSSLVVYKQTCRQAAAYMSTKKTAKAEQQVNSNHAEWESADLI